MFMLIKLWVLDAYRIQKRLFFQLTQHCYNRFLSLLNRKRWLHNVVGLFYGLKSLLFKMEFQLKPYPCYEETARFQLGLWTPPLQTRFSRS